MSKLILSTMAAALVCVAGSAQAENAVSAKTLNEMGLSGLAVISDVDATSIRGMGWKTMKREIKAPWSAASGNSFATIVDEHGAVTHSQNGYAAEGAFSAAGENFSTATLTTTEIEQVTVNGVTNTITNIWSINVQAGGFSSATSF